MAEKYLVFKMSRQTALELGLLICKCGHMPNNHFEFDCRSCAHCKCQAYTEKARAGELLGDFAIVEVVDCVNCKGRAAVKKREGKRVEAVCLDCGCGMQWTNV